MVSELWLGVPDAAEIKTRFLGGEREAKLRKEEKRVEPHNRRTTPHNTMLNIAIAILGDGVLVSLSRSDNHPLQMPLLEWKPLVGVVYGWWSPQGGCIEISRGVG